MLSRNLGRRSGAVARDLAERLGPESSRDELVLALNHCASAGDLEQGRQIHAKITQRRLRSSSFLANHLIKMYGDCGDATSALAVFARLKRRNVFSWNLAIAACGGEDLSMGLYRSMLLEGQLPDNITFVNLIAGRSRSLEEGKVIHEHAVESGSIADVVVATAMVSLYGRLDQIAEAKKIFDAMPEKNQVSWTAMITAYARNGYRSEASIELYFQMTRIHALDPDRVTFIALLESCTSGSLALRDGAMIEQEIVARGLDGEPSIAVALVTMFARCGGIDSARIAFDRACHCKNIGSAAWTAMVAAYAQHGHLELAVEIHRLMALDGQDCDSVTFVNLLFACSHAGRLHDAWNCFASMSGDFWVESVLDHYVCVVDLLGRLGKLEEAEDLATNMPFEPVESVWMSFLSAILCSLE